MSGVLISSSTVSNGDSIRIPSLKANLPSKVRVYAYSESDYEIRLHPDAKSPFVFKGGERCDIVVSKVSALHFIGSGEIHVAIFAGG